MKGRYCPRTLGIAPAVISERRRHLPKFSDRTSPNMVVEEGQTQVNGGIQTFPKK